MLTLIKKSNFNNVTKQLKSGSLQRFFSQTQDSNPRRESTHSSVDPREVETFSKIKDWWDPNGSQRALHAYNHARVNYIKRMYHIYNGDKVKNRFSMFEGLDMIDVGCGPGLFCESAARLKGNVWGIDATKNTIEIAQEHAKLDPSIAENLHYVHTTAEVVAGLGKKFDIVTSLEVIEHVSDKNFFIEQLVKLAKDGGFVFISTINKTYLAYAITILGAEILTRIVPSGTHEWDKYISPDELSALLKSNGLRVLNTQGFMYNPLTNSMAEVADTSVNYIITCKKE